MSSPCQYFSVKELADRETGICQLAPAQNAYIGFAARIDGLRRAWGKQKPEYAALYVNSCCRSKRRNTRIGGHPRSLHVYDEPFHNTGGAAAIDFRLFNDPAVTEEFKKLAIFMNFSVGDEQSCIHIDDRTALLGLPQQRFKYETKTIN